MTSPELSHLHLLTMVGELGSLGRAAEKLGISQPAASKRMAAMRAAVADGAGPAVMSMMTVRVDLEGGRLVEVPVTGMDLHRRLRAVWSNSRPLTDTEGRLLQIAVQSYRATPTQGPRS